jgi:hypothetical protein
METAMDESYSSTLKSIGAIVLTLALFFGVGYYVYESLVVGPAPAQNEDVVATGNGAQPAAQPASPADQKQPS